jgi:glutamate 5-kinase
VSEVLVPAVQDNPDAKPIYEVEDINQLTADTTTSGTQWGTGGMATKLTAARIATAAGTAMVGRAVWRKCSQE